MLHQRCRSKRTSAGEGEGVCSNGDVTTVYFEYFLNTHFCTNEIIFVTAPRPLGYWQTQLK